MKLFYALLLMTFSCISAAESAATSQSVEHRSYIISPHSPAEIKSEVMRRSPIRSGQDAVNKHTDWHINWNYRTVTDRYGCQINDLKIKLRVRHALPRLNRYVTDEKTIEAFNRFISTLKQNEKIHGQNGSLAAREIEQAISSIPPQADCHSLSQIVEDTTKAIVQKYAQKDNKNDRAPTGDDS